MAEEENYNFLNGINSITSDVYFKGIAESIPHVLCLADPENYRIQYVNKVQPGYTKESIIGVELFSFIRPEHMELYKQAIAEVKKSGKPVLFEVAVNTPRYPGGKAWYRTQISMIRGAENSKDSLVFFAEDITDNKLREFENINKEEKIKSIINNTHDIICSIDSNFNLTEFNSVFSDMVKNGYEVELQQGMSVLQFIDPLKHEYLKSLYKKVLNGEVCSDIQSFNTLNGFTVYNETNYNPINNSENKVIGISIFSKDITERIKNEQKIINTLKEKEVLLSEIHHRIKNNLALVSSMLQLQEMNINSTEAKEALLLSRKRIKSTALIHELLYKSESFQSINLKDYLCELFQLLKISDSIQLSLNGDNVTFNISIALPLGLMLNEIMLNSFKHAGRDGSGKIEIHISSTPGSLGIDYCDCEGVFPDTVDFKKPSTTGLTLIHTFAEQLDGHVELISKVPPKYKIHIPLNEN